MMTQSNLPKVTALVSVIAKQSGARVGVFIVSTQPTLMALLPSLQIMAFLCLHWDKLLMHLDALTGHLSPASAQGKLELLFFPLAALLCSCPPYSVHLSHCSDLSTSLSHPLRGQVAACSFGIHRRQHSAWHSAAIVNVL